MSTFDREQLLETLQNETEQAPNYWHIADRELRRELEGARALIKQLEMQLSDSRAIRAELTKKRDYWRERFEEGAAEDVEALQDEVQRLEALCAAESAARRVAERRLQHLQAETSSDRRTALLRHIQSIIQSHLAGIEPRPYDFKVIP